MSLGIDFGTATTVFASCDGGRLRVLKDDEEEDIIPSVIAYTPMRRVKIGKAARRRTLIDSANTLHSFKRVLDKQWHNPDVAAFRRQYSFEIERSDAGDLVFVTRGGKLTAAQVTEQFLGHTCKFASLGSRGAESVIVGVPEMADQRQHDETVQAVQQAGFPQADVISEPAAAVLAYLYKESRNHKLLVYDFGGGTFDAALVQWNGLRPVVLGAAGDSYLGGDDFDRICADWAAEQILKEHRWDVHADTGSLRRLIYLCEQAKRRLSISDQTMINLESVDQALTGRSLKLTRDCLHQLCEGLIGKTFRVCDSLFNKLQVKPKELDGIVMAGGSTYMPIVRIRVEERFKRPLLTELPADRLVAMGAALLAQQRASAR